MAFRFVLLLVFTDLSLAQKRGPAIADPSSCTFENFVQWAKGRGASFANVVSADFLEEFTMDDTWLSEDVSRKGFLVPRKIDRGEELIKFPLSTLAITIETIRAGPLGAVESFLTRSSLFALQILSMTTSPDSEWLPFTCMLPRSVDLLLSRKVTDALEEEGERLTIMRYQLRKDWNDLFIFRANFSHLLPPGVLTLENYAWAVRTSHLLVERLDENSADDSPAGVGVFPILSVLKRKDLKGAKERAVFFYKTAAWGVRRGGGEGGSVSVVAESEYFTGEELELKDEFSGRTAETGRVSAKFSRVTFEGLFGQWERCVDFDVKKWVEERGASAPDVGVGRFVIEHLETQEDYWWLRDGPTRRGVVALRNIPPFKIIARCPIAVGMNYLSALNSTLRPVIEANSFLSERGAEILTLHLMLEARDSNSKWAPHICGVASSEDLPIFDEILKNKNSLVARGIRNFRRQIRARWNRIMPWARHVFPDLFPREKVTLSHWAWAQAALSSRTWAPDINKKPTLTMIPFMDLFNHKDGFHGVTIENDGQNFDEIFLTVVAPSTGYLAGQEVFISYKGEDKNAELATHYGIEKFPQVIQDFENRKAKTLREEAVQKMDAKTVEE